MFLQSVTRLRLSFLEGMEEPSWFSLGFALWSWPKHLLSHASDSPGQSGDLPPTPIPLWPNTSLQRERDDLTNILDVDPPPLAWLWPGRAGSRHPPCWTSFYSPSCHRPSSLPPPSRDVSGLLLPLSCPLCVCQDSSCSFPPSPHPPGARPSAFHSCPFAFTPRPGASTSAGL